VDRIDFLLGQAAGKRVIHVGFAGELATEELPGHPDALWLHGRLAQVSAGLVGIDLDRTAVEMATAKRYEAHVADCSDPQQLRDLAIPKAEVVLAGEIIEHLETPGSFLDGMHELVAAGGRLIVTTPNAASLLNPLAAMARYELINPTHVAVYSWYTLSNILGRHGWDVRGFLTYHHPLPPRVQRSWGKAAERVAARVQRLSSRVWPFVDFGLIAVATPQGQS